MTPGVADSGTTEVRSGREPLALDGWRHIYSGKVRDIYEPVGTSTDNGSGNNSTSHDDASSEDRLLFVASDRISAYDHILRTPIPGKGAVLTQLSLWWFDRLAAEVPLAHQILGSSEAEGVPAPVLGRAVVCRRLEMIPVECIVRGYLTGSGYAAYQSTGEICGVKLPPGLHDGSRLETPIFTPSAKAAVGEHDENIDFAAVIELVGQERANELRQVSLRLYTAAETIARERGIIVADTKFEFGLDAEGRLVLADEVLTPDSSRFWDAQSWHDGQQASFDKQYVRDWLKSPQSGWDGSGELPTLPQGVVAKTQERYFEAYSRLTGETFRMDAAL